MGIALLATTATFAQTMPSPPTMRHPRHTPEEKAARKADHKAKMAAMSPQERKAFRQTHRQQREARLAEMSPEKRQRVMERRQMRKQGK